MEFLQTTEGLLIFSLVGLMLFCAILYYVIKSAIVDALKQSKRGNNSAPLYTPSIPTPNWNAAQIALKDKYEKGEITIDEYTNEWNKL